MERKRYLIGDDERWEGDCDEGRDDEDEEIATRGRENRSARFENLENERKELK